MGHNNAQWFKLDHLYVLYIHVPLMSWSYSHGYIALHKLCLIPPQLKYRKDIKKMKGASHFHSLTSEDNLALKNARKICKSVSEVRLVTIKGIVCSHRFHIGIDMPITSQTNGLLLILHTVPCQCPEMRFWNLWDACPVMLWFIAKATGHPLNLQLYSTACLYVLNSKWYSIWVGALVFWW